MKTAGYDELVDGVLDPHNLISCVNRGSCSTPEKMATPEGENGVDEDTIAHIPDPVSSPFPRSTLTVLLSFFRS